MKRNVFIVFIGIMIISLFSLFYAIKTNSAKPTGTIDLEGGNDFWHVSLNIHLQYDSELIITPKRDDFKIPSEISTDIIVNNNSVYTDRLKYIPDSFNKNYLGSYRVRLNSDEIISDDYFKKDNNEVYIIIRFNNESSKIILRKQY
jgi:hypothetical protein